MFALLCYNKCKYSYTFTQVMSKQLLSFLLPFSYFSALLFVLIAMFTGVKVSAVSSAPKLPPEVCNQQAFSQTTSFNDQNVCPQTSQLPVQDQIINLVKSLNSSLIQLAPVIAVVGIIWGAIKVFFNGFKAAILIFQWTLIGVVLVVISFSVISIVLALIGVS